MHGSSSIHFYINFRSHVKYQESQSFLLLTFSIAVLKKIQYIQRYFHLTVTHTISAYVPRQYSPVFFAIHASVLQPRYRDSSPIFPIQDIDNQNRKNRPRPFKILRTEFQYRVSSFSPSKENELPTRNEKQRRRKNDWEEAICSATTTESSFRRRLHNVQIPWHALFIVHVVSTVRPTVAKQSYLEKLKRDFSYGIATRGTETDGDKEMYCIEGVAGTGKCNIIKRE